MSINFTLALIDKMTGPSKAITGSMSSMVTQAKALTSAMKETESQMAKANALGDVAKVTEMKFRLLELKEELDKLPAAAKHFEEASAILGAAAKGAAAGIGVAIAAFGAAIAGGVALAIQATETRKKLEATFTALTGSDAVVDQLDGLTSKLGMTREVLAPLAEQLLGMGVPLAQLQGHLTALATVTAVGITGGTEVYLQILKKLSAQTKVSSKDLANLYKTGVNVSEVAGSMGLSVKQLQAGLKAATVDASKFSSALTAAVTAKGAGALANQAKSLSAQWAVAKETVLDLFSGIDTSPLLDAFHELVGTLDQANPSGQALKVGLTGTFNAVFAVAGKVVAFLKTSFLHLIILGLQIYIMVKQHKTAFEALGAVLTGIVAGAIAAVIVSTWSLVAATASLAVAVLAATWPFIAVGAAIGGVVFLIAKLVQYWAPVRAFLQNLSDGAWKAAGSFVDGLVGGIKAGVSRAVAAVKNLGHSVLAGVKDVLGIHSPSVEMMKIGVHTATGFAQGVAAGNDNAMTASSGLASSAMGGAAAGAPGGAAGTGGGLTIIVEKGAVVVNGGSSAQEQQAQLESGLVVLIERIALQQGIGTAA